MYDMLTGEVTKKVNGPDLLVNGKPDSFARNQAQRRGLLIEDPPQHCGFLPHCKHFFAFPSKCMMKRWLL
jgi:hypothetical protein